MLLEAKLRSSAKAIRMQVNLPSNKKFNELKGPVKWIVLTIYAYCLDQRFQNYGSQKIS